MTPGDFGGIGLGGSWTFSGLRPSPSAGDGVGGSFLVSIIGLGVRTCVGDLFPGIGNENTLSKSSTDSLSAASWGACNGDRGVDLMEGDGATLLAGVGMLGCRNARSIPLVKFDRAANSHTCGGWINP